METLIANSFGDELEARISEAGASRRGKKQQKITSGLLWNGKTGISERVLSFS